MQDKHVNEAAKIVVLPSAIRAAYRAEESQSIQKVIRENLLLTSTEPYCKVQVSVRHASDGRPESLTAYMLRSYTYTVDVRKVRVGGDYSFRSVDASYAATDEDVEAWPIPVEPKPVLKPRMVFATPVPEIPTAKAAVVYLYNMATLLGYKCVRLLGPSANLANYKKYLTGHLWAFVNIGHGNTEGIVLSDGFLSYQVLAGAPKTLLRPEVVYFNSCQVFNAPLQPAIMAAGARTFVGGKVNLLIGASEEVCKCFWTSILKKALPMGRSLVACEKAKYPTPGCHGISGDLGKFKPIP
jgi:hypothetical protein